MKLMNLQLLTVLSLAMLLAACDSLGLKKSDHAKGSTVETTVEAQVIATPAPTEAPQEQKFDTVWERMRTGYGLPEVSNSAVDAKLRFYTKYKTYFYKITQQSEPYLHYVVSEMQAHNMPMELALLPFIESSYNPVAASANNLGMWQFGAATGRSFGLKQNRWYDGRRDVVASTDAAIRLLKKLYTRFDNDWLLAVAAYNAGDGSVQQAINKNRRAGKPTDFWSLPLSKTTQGYIPQLLALSKIVAKPEVYDFKLYPIADAPYFARVNVDSQINLADAAKSSSLDSSLLKKLNAGFSGWLTDPTEPRDLLVPVDAATTFKLKLDSLPKIANQTHTHTPITDSTQNTYHIVKSGESLWSIAKAKHTTVAALTKLNNFNAKSALKPGQKIMIAAPAPEAKAIETKVLETNKVEIKTVETNKVETQAIEAQQSIENSAEANVKTQKKSNYIIQTGDTLGEIAAKHAISLKQIMEWNKITDEKNIRPNQELIIMAESAN